jgi:hypothetical protein
MTRGKKPAVGTGLLVFGLVWFFLDLIWLPPGLLILSVLLSPRYLHLVDPYFGFIWQAEYFLSATTAAAGLLVLCGASWKLSRKKTYFIVIGGAGLAAFGLFFVIWLLLKF